MTEEQILEAIRNTEAEMDLLMIGYEEMQRQGFEEFDRSQYKDAQDYLITLHHDLKRVRAGHPLT